MCGCGYGRGCECEGHGELMHVMTWMEENRFWCEGECVGRRCDVLIHSNKQSN